MTGPENRLIQGRGTEETSWQAWTGWSRADPVSCGDLVPEGARLVVVAPHPDDEVLGAGGLISLASRSGRQVLVVGVTDGAASHPGSSLWPADELVDQRRFERLAALTVLGLRPPLVVCLGFGDGRVADGIAELSRRLVRIIKATDVVVSPWHLDGHPDHEATATAVADATTVIGAQHLQSPIWGWHWASPDADDLPGHGSAVLALDEVTVKRKQRALECFTSQITEDPTTGAGPILPSWVLDRLTRNRELFLR
ncbi:PIG-L family deacetylase [soil metagenome]